jgi:hypothetical protein
VDSKQTSAAGRGAQGTEARAFEVVTIEQVISIEGDQPTVGMHNVNASFLHRAHIKRIGIQKIAKISDESKVIPMGFQRLRG